MKEQDVMIQTITVGMDQSGLIRHMPTGISVSFSGGFRERRAAYAELEEKVRNMGTVNGPEE